MQDTSLICPERNQKQIEIVAIPGDDVGLGGGDHAQDYQGCLGLCVCDGFLHLGEVLPEHGETVLVDVFLFDQHPNQFLHAGKVADGGAAHQSRQVLDNLQGIGFRSPLSVAVVFWKVAGIVSPTQFHSVCFLQ